MSRHHDKLYSHHISLVCDKITKYITGVSWDEFEINSEKQDAVIRQLGGSR